MHVQKYYRATAVATGITFDRDVPEVITDEVPVTITGVICVLVAVATSRLMPTSSLLFDLSRHERKIKNELITHPQHIKRMIKI